MNTTTKLPPNYTPQSPTNLFNEANYMQRHSIFALIFGLASMLVFPGAIKIAYSEEIELDSIIAIVNDDIVLSSDFVRERETLKRQNPANLPSGTELDKTVLERLIIQSLQIQTAERRGIRIDDASLQRAIEDMARNNKMSVTQMRETLSRDGINFLEFRENIRKELIISTLTRREVETNLNVSDAEIEELMSVENASATTHSYELDHILVKLPQQADPDLTSNALTTAQQVASDGRDGIPFSRVVERLRNGGNADIEGGNLGSRTIAEMPALFADQVEGMQDGDVTEPLRSAAGFHVLKLVSKTSKLATTKRVRARHILASTRNGRTAGEAKALITEIAAKLSEGADFANLAITASEDPASAAKGGDLGWFGRGEMVPQFERLAFATAPNQVTAPFFTDFGWHIMEVTDRELDASPRDDLESKVRSQLRRKKAEEKFQIWLTDLRDGAYVELRGYAKNL